MGERVVLARLHLGIVTAWRHAMDDERNVLADRRSGQREVPERIGRSRDDGVRGHDVSASITGERRRDGRQRAARHEHQCVVEGQRPVRGERGAGDRRRQRIEHVTLPSRDPGPPVPLVSADDFRCRRTRPAGRRPPKATGATRTLASECVVALLSKMGHRREVGSVRLRQKLERQCRAPRAMGVRGPAGLRRERRRSGCG